MKKLISAILICASVMSCTACKNNTETSSSFVPPTGTTSSEAEETTITPTTQATDIATETEGTSVETEPSETETTAPVSVPTPAETIELKNELTKLDYDVKTTQAAYAAKDPGSGLLQYVSCLYDKIEINSDGYDTLKESLDWVFLNEAEFHEENYAKALHDFTNNLSSGATINSSSTSDRVTVYRADSTVLSFKINSSWCNIPNNDLGRDNYCDKTYCYNTKTAEYLNFEDIVKDKDALCAYLRANVNSGTDNGFCSASPDAVYNAVEIAAYQIMGGQSPFLLTYDGIIIVTEDNEFYVSAVNCPDCFNMEYFLDTPENYLISSDFSNTISWDLNGDGKVETISLESDKDNNYKVHIGDTVSDLKCDGSECFPYPDSCFYLVHTSSGYRLSFGGSIGSDYRTEVIYKVKDDLTLEYIESGYYVTSSEYISDPSEFELNFFSEDTPSALFGAVPYRSYFTLAGEHVEKDTSEKINDFWGRPFLTLTECTCKAQKADGEWKEYTLPSGSTVANAGFSPETQELIFIELHEYRDENKTLRLPVSENGKVICGINATELFDGLPIGD